MPARLYFFIEGAAAAMKKTMLSFLLALTVLMGLLPVTAQAEPGLISSLSLTVSAAQPMAGTKRFDKTPAITVPAGSNYTLSGAYKPSWLEEGGGMSSMPSDYTFEAGKVYYLSIPLVAKDGYAFESGEAATGNYEGRYKLKGSITLDVGEVYTSAITGNSNYGTEMTVVVKLTAQKAKDVYIDNTVDNSKSYITGVIHLNGSGGIQAGYGEGVTVYEDSASVTYSNPKTSEVQGRINDAYTKVYNLANGVKSRGKSGEINMSTSESTGKVWDNRKYETVEDGDAVLIGDSDYLTGAYGVGGADGLTRTHIASGDYGKETFYRVEANGTVEGWAVAVTAGEGGAASASLTEALRDTEITLTATPDTGYEFSKWEVVSGGVAVENNAFTMPAADVELKAIFRKASIGLCLGGTAGGSYAAQNGQGDLYGDETVTDSMNISINYGDTLRLKAIPDEGHKFLGWYEGVVGNSRFVEEHSDRLISANAEYSFPVTQYAALQAVFEKAAESPEAPAYRFTKGENAVWMADSADDLVFVVQGSPDDSTTFADFLGIEVDGGAVGAKNYTAEKGSVIITLKKAYLATLAMGEHTLKVLLAGGSAETKFTVKERETAPVPAAPVYAEGGYDFRFSFRMQWQGDTEKSSNWTLYNASGAVVHKSFNKRVISDTEWLYEAWFASGGDYYIIEKAPAGYKVRYENVGAHAGETDRCYNGGTIINYKVPRTGDGANLALWLGCAVTGVAAIAAAVCAGKKRRARG